MNVSRFFAVLGFICLGVASRFFPHPPNFTAINAIALFGVCALGSLRISLVTVLTAMLLSDLAIGLHSTILFVYLGFGLVVCMGHWLRSCRLPILLIASSMLFFAITNFGVWLIDPLYPRTFSGLGACYLAAIPFLGNQILGDLTYGFALFGVFSFVERLAPVIRLQSPG